MRRLILLIDDDPDEMAIFSAALEMAGAGYNCIAACSGIQALELLEDIKPDYIFLDMNMPRMNGLACLVALRRLPKLDSVPIILYSTGADSLLRDAAMRLGANDCIKKSDSMQQQAAGIAQVLEEYTA